jgi:secondary thiamine-phosphate synthase enzyme
VVHTTLALSTEEAPHFFDLTDVVKALVEQSNIHAGTALVFSKHTTAAVAVIEHEPLLLDDIAEMLWHLIPPSTLYRYHHDDFSVRTVNMTDDEHENGHAHCQHLFIGASCHLPIVEGSLELGQWQRIFFVELDRPRTRQVVIQVSGVAEHP